MDVKSPRHLAELEPSPVDETAPSSSKDYFPLQRPTHTLGLSGHNLPWYLLRIQRYSSYTFTLFTALHITNTSLLPLLTRSVPSASKSLLLTRPYYQSHPFAEPLLVLLPLLGHIASGLLLRLHRRRALLRRYGDDRDTSRADRRRIAWPHLSGISALGYLAVPLVVGHAAVARGLPWWVEGGSSGIGLEYVSHGFWLAPGVSAVVYGALVGVVGMHVVWGWAKCLGWTPEQVGAEGREGMLARKRRWWVVNGIGALVVGIWMAGGLGIVGRGGKAGGWVRKGYDELYRRIPILGRWV